MASEKEEGNKAPTGSVEHQKSDLLASAKVLAGAAQSAFGGEGAAVDRAKVAEASEELLEAANKYGKLEEKGYGSYLEKAEGYLHQAASSDKPAKPSSPEKVAEGEHSTPEEKSSKKEESGGGFGGLFKAAQGFLKK